MSIPFECLYDKSEQATVAGYFLYITFRIDCPTTSNCGAHCWEQAGEEWIMPGESKLAACESGESAGVEGALHHVPAIALRFCLWKAEYVRLYQRVGRAAGKGSLCTSSTSLAVPQEPAVQHPRPALFSQ